MTEEQLERLRLIADANDNSDLYDYEREALRALLTEHKELKAGRLKMYVWTDQVSFLAVAHAVSVAAAREQVLTYELTGGDGSCVEREKAREYVMNQSPAIYVGPNTEFTLSDSGELREQEDYSEQLHKQVKELEATVERQRKALEFYADPQSWSTWSNDFYSGVSIDETDEIEGEWVAGKRARAALQSNAGQTKGEGGE